MRKLTTLLVLGAGAAGFPSLARAADVAQILCGANAIAIIGTSFSSGVTVPSSCAVSSNCAPCLAALLSNGFYLQTTPPNGNDFVLYTLQRGQQQQQ
jgi:hypothetical protein